MPRIIPGPLLAILADDTASLSTLLEFRRRDGTFIRLTDTNIDITIGGQVFLCNGSYERSAFSQTDGFEVDDLKITGHFDDNAVTEDDVRNRLYAGSIFRLWGFSPEDPSLGRFLIVKGVIGRIAPLPDDSFIAELRSLKDKFRTVINREFTYECAVQLGSIACGIPLAPVEVQRDAAYITGEFIRFASHSSEPTRIIVPVLNPSFESTTSSKPDDWTEIRGEVIVAISNVELTGPANGNNFLTGELNFSEFAIDQTVAITGLGISNASIDASQVKLSISIRRATGKKHQRDYGRFLIEALDGSSNVLDEVFDTGFENVSETNKWLVKGQTEIIVPVGTRSLRLECDGRRRSQARCDAAFDDIHIQIYDDATPLGQAKWEDRIYECIVGGVTASSAPTYDTVVGNDTVDGTATFRATEAWTRVATIATVINQQNMTLTITEPRAVDDWFNHGLIFWETGNNAGTGMEIKDWTQTGDVLELFIPMRPEISVGDRVRLFPGCTRGFTVCRDKFDNVINYRGFPDIPGADFVAQYPDQP